MVNEFIQQLKSKIQELNQDVFYGDFQHPVFIDEGTGELYVADLNTNTCISVIENNKTGDVSKYFTWSPENK